MRQESKNPAQVVHNSCALICATGKFLWRFLFGYNKKETETGFRKDFFFGPFQSDKDTLRDKQIPFQISFSQNVYPTHTDRTSAKTLSEDYDLVSQLISVRIFGGGGFLYIF